MFCKPNLDFRLFLTEDGSSKGDVMLQSPDYPSLHIRKRRFMTSDLIDCLPLPEKRHNTVSYVCGPPRMTDYVVSFLKSQDGIIEENVLCEKWW